MRKKTDQIQRIAGHIQNDAQQVKRFLWEIQRIAIEKKNCKDIWTLAKKALAHL